MDMVSRVIVFVGLFMAFSTLSHRALAGESAECAFPEGHIKIAAFGGTTLVPNRYVVLPDRSLVYQGRPGDIGFMDIGFIGDIEIDPDTIRSSQTNGRLVIDFLTVEDLDQYVEMTIVHDDRNFIRFVGEAQQHWKHVVECFDPDGHITPPLWPSVAPK